MIEILIPIIVALIAAAPATVASAAAWRNSRAVNHAVNNRKAGEPTLSDDVRATRAKVETLEEQFAGHLYWHEQQSLRRVRGL